MRNGRRNVKGLGIGAATAACALAFAGSAEAKTLDFSGPIGPSGAISFSVKGNGDRAKVQNLEWFRIEVDCKGGDDTSTGALNYDVEVNDGKFSADAVLGNPERPKAEAIIKGKINGDRSHGSIIVRGSRVPISEGNGDCDSGKHPWNAAG